MFTFSSSQSLLCTRLLSTIVADDGWCTTLPAPPDLVEEPSSSLLIHIFILTHEQFEEECFQTIQLVLHIFIVIIIILCIYRILAECECGGIDVFEMSADFVLLQYWHYSAIVENNVWYDSLCSLRLFEEIPWLPHVHDFAKARIFFSRWSWVTMVLWMILWDYVLSILGSAAAAAAAAAACMCSSSSGTRSSFRSFSNSNSNSSMLCLYCVFIQDYTYYTRTVTIIWCTCINCVIRLKWEGVDVWCL